MADNQYEYRINQLPVPNTANKLVRMIWFRSTNYTATSPYGWHVLTVTCAVSDEEMLNMVKVLKLMRGCELIPARQDTNNEMSVLG